MTLDYFYGQSGELFAYFRIPKALFQDSRFRQLSTDARTLYGILLDRMSLSAKNSWVDEHGRVYIMLFARTTLKCRPGIWSFSKPQMWRHLMRLSKNIPHPF